MRVHVFLICLQRVSNLVCLTICRRVFTGEQQRFVELNIAELHTIGRELTDVQRERFLQLQQHIVSLETQLRVSFHQPPVHAFSSFVTFDPNSSEG